MITLICLAYVGYQLNAPEWYYTLLVIRSAIILFDFGIKMYKAGVNKDI